MGPSDFVHKVLVSSIVFTVIAAALMMGIAYVGYSSDVMHANLRRIMSSGLVIVCVIGIAAGLYVFFPHQAKGVLDTLAAMASPR
jgi:hypothetical protein